MALKVDPLTLGYFLSNLQSWAGGATISGSPHSNVFYYLFTWLGTSQYYPPRAEVSCNVEGLVHETVVPFIYTWQLLKTVSTPVPLES